MNRLRPRSPLAFLLVLTIIFVPGIAITAALAANQLGYCVDELFPGDPGLNARPYLLQIDSDSATLRMRATVARDATVTLAAPDADPVVIAVPAAKLQTVELPGLRSGIDYRYTIERGDSTWDGSFRIPAGPDDTIRFAVIGSSGVASDAQHQIAAELVDAAPDLLIHTGDVVFPRGALCHYGLRYFGPYQELIGDTLVAPVAGEVDLKSSDGEPFTDAFGDPSDPTFPTGYRTFHAGPVRFVLLDSERYRSNDQAAIDEQRAWLTDLLSSHDLPWTVVVIHRPPYSSTDGAAAQDILDDLGPIFARNGVDLVLSGHARNYERFQPDGSVTYIVSGGGGAPLQPLGPNRTSVSAASTHHFIQIDAGPDAMTMRVIGVDGTVIDSFRLDRAG